MRSELRISGHAWHDAHAEALAAARAGWLGRMAKRLGLFPLLDDFHGNQERVERATYRAHHACAVTAASPLALDLLAHEGIDVDELASDLRPRAEWRRWICGPPPSVHSFHDRWSVGAAHPSPEDAGDIDLFLQGGVILREWSDPDGALGIRLSKAGLEIGARLGPVHLRTIEGIATVTTAVAIPETVKAAAIGQPVEALFGHPVLSGRGYVISDQYDRVPTAEDPREAWRIEFRAEPVPWRVPWARPMALGAGDFEPRERVEVRDAVSRNPVASLSPGKSECRT